MAVSRLIPAQPDQVWRAFMDPAALLDWLPPAGMTGQLHDFDPRVGGGYRMSLFYPPDETGFQGKSAQLEDLVRVRFREIDPARRIVQAVTFVTDDPAFKGEMTMTWTIQPMAEGTQVTVLSENLPPGLRPEDNDEGARQSLDQLARRFET